MKNNRLIRIFSRMTSAIMALCVTASVSAAEYTTVKHPDWSRNAVIYEVNVRQYTPEGTFKAFAEHLPRLKDLGVDVIWFMPIHPISKKNSKGELGSYYAVADYKGVNPEFGNLDDFKDVVRRAHDLGMKVVIDWVPNHSGCDNPWVEQHPDWYERNADGEMFGPFDWTDVYKFDYSNPALREAMTEAMLFWLTDAGIDGFRCDVASMVPVDYWNEARPRLQAACPELFMLAEASEPALEEHAFDMAYNWPMKDLFSRIAARAGQYTFVAPGADAPKLPDAAEPAEIFTLNAELIDKYPADAYMMNMITNHDLNSWEGTEFKRLGNLADAFAVLTYTLPGMPLIYTGQEVGMDRPFEFFVKDTAPDFNPNKYTAFYKKLNTLKHGRPELAAGTAGGGLHPYKVSDPNIIVFSRTLDGSTTLVGVNLGAESAPVRFVGEAPTVHLMADLFSDDVARLPETLAPGEYFVFVSRKIR